VLLDSDDIELVKSTLHALAASVCLESGLPCSVMHSILRSSARATHLTRSRRLLQVEMMSLDDTTAGESELRKRLEALASLSIGAPDLDLKELCVEQPAADVS